MQTYWTGRHCGHCALAGARPSVLTGRHPLGHRPSGLRLLSVVPDAASWLLAPPERSGSLPVALAPEATVATRWTGTRAQRLSRQPSKLLFRIMAGRPSPERESIPAALLRLVARGEATTRASLARALGLAPSTAALHVESLIGRGLIEERGNGSSTGGRPPRVLSIRPEGGVIVGIDLGERHLLLRADDLAGRNVAQASSDISIADGPDAVAATVAGLCRAVGKTLPGPVLAIGVAVPGPVAQPSGVVTSPSRMPGWDGVNAQAVLTRATGAPTLVDNDANLLALGESAAAATPPASMIAVKISRGIGCGIMSDHQLLRGRSGAAGDMSHSPSSDGAELCDCGKTGCLEAVASGAALVRRAQIRGCSVTDPAHVIELAVSGDRMAQADLRESGRLIGEALARYVDFFNPETVILGGVLSSYPSLVASLRTAVFQDALPLASATLEIRTTSLGSAAISIGATQLAFEDALSKLTYTGNSRDDV